MKTIFTTNVNGVELRFTSKGIDLDPNHDLDDTMIRAIYAFGQKIHPIIVQLHKAKGTTTTEDLRLLAGKFPANQRNFTYQTLRQANNGFYIRHAQPGYVYLVKNDHDLYKIGRTKELERRMKRFEVKLPFPVETIALIETYEPAAEERLWHERFADKRMDGEWFALDDGDVAWMQQYDVRYTQEPDEIDVPTPNPTSHLWQYGDRSNGW